MANPDKRAFSQRQGDRPSGLTFREYSAVHLTAAYITSMPGEPRLPGETYEEAASKAIRMTDALIAALGDQ